MKTELRVTQFTDFRGFLAAHINEMRAKKPSWTYGMWAKSMGLKATSSITKVVQGNRDPGPELTDRLATYFGFREKDALYFRDLVRLHKLRRDARLSVALMEKMGKTFPDGSVRLLDDKTFSVISNWYYLPLRELVRTSEFREDAEWIAKKFRFKVSPREIQQALNVMEELKLLVRDPSTKKLKATDGWVKTTNDIGSEAIKRAHEQHLDNAKSALRNAEVDEREITASCFVLKTANLPRAKELIREFKHRFAELLEEEAGDAVYQIQIQLFPLTKKGRPPT